MNLKQSRRKDGRVYLSIEKSYRDKNGCFLQAQIPQFCKDFSPGTIRGVAHSDLMGQMIR